MKKYDIIKRDVQIKITGITPSKITACDNPDIWIDLETINCRTSSHYPDDLGIIRGDIEYTVRHADTDKFILITDWNSFLTKEHINLLKTYLKDTDTDIDKTPVFFVVSTEYPDVDKLMGLLVENGFSTADHMADFENNYTLVLTSKKMYRKLSKNCII